MNAYQNCEMKAKPHGQTSNTSILDAIHHHLLLKGMDGPKLSYKARLPSTGRDVLVVGPLYLTQPLSLALAHVQFDGQTAGAASANRAVDVLRKHCSYTSPTRKCYIHTVESLENNNWDFHIDHIVLVTTPEDKHLLRQAQRMLDDDYIKMQRVTIVEAQHGHFDGATKEARENYETNFSCLHGQHD